MSIRASALSMVLVVIPPFSGFLKALLNPKSMLSYFFLSQANLLLDLVKDGE